MVCSVVNSHIVKSVSQHTKYGETNIVNENCYDFKHCFVSLSTRIKYNIYSMWCVHFLTDGLAWSGHDFSYMSCEVKYILACSWAVVNQNMLL